CDVETPPNRGFCAACGTAERGERPEWSACARGTALAASPPLGGRTDGDEDGRERGQCGAYPAPEAAHDPGGVRARDRGHRLDGEPVGELPRRAEQARLEGDQ